MIDVIDYEDFETQFSKIENILSPAAIKRDWNRIEIDVGIPLAPNLRSMARILGGFYRYSSINPPNLILQELNFHATGGIIGRDENGKLVGVVDTLSPINQAQRISEKIGTDKIEFASEESVLSIDPSNPTIFTSISSFTFPKGETLLEYTYPQDVHYETKTLLNGFLEENIFKGSFDTVWETTFPNGNFTAKGVFEIRLI